MNRKKIFIGILVAILILYFLLLFIEDAFNSSNISGRMLGCENQLKMIAKAMNLYRIEWDGQWPESLEAMKKYFVPPNRIPKCPGERNEDETSDYRIYFYFKPKVEEVVPVCWDSKPHYNKKAKLFPSIKKWNVLYSDGDIERLFERELLRELSQLANTNPDVLKVLNLLDEQ